MRAEPPRVTLHLNAQPQGSAMLFLVISTPAPTEPSAVRDRRQRYWEWIAPLRGDGTVRSVHARVGRGAVVLFDVESPERLHRHRSEEHTSELQSLMRISYAV